MPIIKTKQIAFKLLYLLIVSLAVMSCVPLAKTKYLQDKEGVAPVTEFQNIKPNYKIKPGDYLYIRILTLDEKSNEIFASISGSASGNSNMNTTDQNLYLTSYYVNDSGYISFPLLGKIEASGKTIPEMEETMNKLVSEILREASVVVKLVMYNVSILGEVKNPGKYAIYNNRVNIFEALAMGGDLTTFANRNKVQIIRNQGNKNNIVTVDLQDKSILTSPYYYLQPNDIVYIEPLKNKSYAFETFPYALILGSISTLLIIATYFKR